MKKIKRLNYKEIADGQFSSSWINYPVKRLAIFLVYKFQKIAISANFITLVSVVLVFIGIFFLLFENSKILFLVFLLIAHLLDHIDGIWARIKKQNSEFGSFFDGFLDAVKYFIIDLALIIFYFGYIESFISNSLLLVTFFSLYFIFKGLHYLSFFKLKTNKKNEKMKIFLYANPAERYIVVFPLIVFFDIAFALYIFGLFFLYPTYVIHYVNKRYKCTSKSS